jgi:phosphate transport system protein
VDRPVQQQVLHLFALVAEALARATWALLNADVTLGQGVVDDDRNIDDQVAAVEASLWKEIDATAGDVHRLRQIVGMLLVLPELERSADLAEHIAQRATFSLGGEMTPVSRGIVQRMSEVAIQMWRSVADAYSRGGAQVLELHETDEELDILHDRLTAEVSRGGMQPSAAAQVTLIARFYERLGDHAVNLSRRVATLQA